MKCELCSMTATYRTIDDQGIVHFYCDHHAVPGAERIGQSPTVWKTYRPLMIMIAIIVIATAVTIAIAGDQGTTMISQISRWFMGYFFLIFGGSKAFTWKSFAQSFRGYDPLAKRVPAYGYVYPAIELLIAGMFLAGWQMMIASWVTIVILAITTVGIVRAIRAGETLQCACLGTWITLPLGWVTVAENIVMIVMAIAMVV
jgi:hypothetical protein